MAPVDPFTMYISVIAVIAISMLAISIFCKEDKKGKKREDAPRQQRQAPRQEDLPPGARRRGVRQRRRMVNRDDSDDDDEPPEEDELFDEILQQEGKIGAKKRRKLEEKAERRAQRQAEEEEREERRQREKLLEKQRKKEEKEREALEAEREREEKIRKEEEAKREHEEYLKLKEAFSVEEEGEAEQDADLSSQSLLEEFINHIKNAKVVMLEDLAAHFKLKTQDAINRVQELVAEGRLTGVIDDRGKFIYITMEELQAVAKHMRQHGRVSIVDLAESSNRLINLNPDTALSSVVETVSG